MGKLVPLPGSEHYSFPGETEPFAPVCSLEEVSENTSSRGSLISTPVGDADENSRDLAQPFEDQVWNREAVRAYMLTHLMKGSKVMPKRSRHISKTVEEKSPLDPRVRFMIKRVGTREMIEHRDDNAVVRYISRDTGNGVEYLSEKEYPEGTRQLETILRCLQSWNITDEQDQPVPIDEDTLRDYLDPEEFDFLHEKCLLHNPILAGVAARKSSTESTPKTSDGSDAGKDEPPAIRLAVPEPGVLAGDL